MSAASSTRSCVVRLFTRPSCSLCTGVHYVINRVRLQIPFEYEEVDISADGDAHPYTNDIPVVHLNDTLIAKHRLSEQQLRDALRQHYALR